MQRLVFTRSITVVATLCLFLLSASGAFAQTGGSERVLFYDGNIVSKTYGTSSPFSPTRVSGRAKIAVNGNNQAAGHVFFGVSSTGAFHHYYTEVRIFLNGRARSYRKCTNTTQCVTPQIQGRGSYSARGRFCGDRKDDGRGVICTNYSLAVEGVNR